MNKVTKETIQKAKQFAKEGRGKEFQATALGLSVTTIERMAKGKYTMKGYRANMRPSKNAQESVAAEAFQEIVITGNCLAPKRNSLIFDRPEVLEDEFEELADVVNTNATALVKLFYYISVVLVILLGYIVYRG